MLVQRLTRCDHRQGFREWLKRARDDHGLVIRQGDEPVGEDEKDRMRTQQRRAEPWVAAKAIDYHADAVGRFIPKVAFSPAVSVHTDRFDRRLRQLLQNITYWNGETSASFVGVGFSSLLANSMSGA